MSTHRKQLIALIIGPPAAPNSQSWVKAGVAFVNDGNSISLRLGVLPLTGRLELREAPPTQGAFGVLKVPLA